MPKQIRLLNVFQPLAGSFGGPTATFGTFTLSTQGISGSPAATYGHDLFVAKVNDAGSFAWAVQGDALTHYNLAGASYLATDGAGYLYVTGSYTSTQARIGPAVLPNLSVQKPIPTPPPSTPYTNNYYSDAFVARLNATTGAWDWAVRQGGAYDDVAAQVAVVAPGRVYALGVFAASAPGPPSTQLALLDAATGAWRATENLGPSSLQVHDLALDGAGRLHLAGAFYGASAQFGTLSLAQAGPGLSTGFLARLGAGPLATAPAAAAGPRLEVWPNPAGGGAVWVRGVPGQPVQLLDVLGWALAGGRLPAGGVLAWALPPALPPGLYLVRSAGQVRRLVVE